MPLLRSAEYTPLPALLLASCALLMACQGEDPAVPELGDDVCSAQATPIATIQGDEFQSPMQGQEALVRGVVTFVANKGVYLESLTPDDSPHTSEGLYLDSVDLAATSAPGDLLAVYGTVIELGERRDKQTTLTGIGGAQVCERGLKLPLGKARLPLAELPREASENMRLQFEQALVVTGVWRLRSGEFMVSPEWHLPAPTEVSRPGTGAAEQAWRNRQDMLNLQMQQGRPDPFPVGSSLMRVRGVLGNDGRKVELLLDDELGIIPPGTAHVAPPAKGDVRVLSVNLHNYFNGDGLGGGFPTTRGAETAQEFEQQRQRLVAAFELTRPHLVAVVELENDGFEPDSAAADLLRDLGSATGEGWATADPGTERIGGDQIRVGLYYDTRVLESISPVQMLDSGPFKWGNRPPMAQAFRHLQSGQEFLVVVNHLKSKGGCPDEGENVDYRDGQGCWNRMRAVGAQAMIDWARTLASELAGGRALVLGDLNAYRLEEPVVRILDTGYSDLTASTGLGFEYTYVFEGQAGTLDHAFASPPLLPFVWSAQILKFNAAYPPGMTLESGWLGFSDHDPVMVDIRFIRPSTSP